MSNSDPNIEVDMKDQIKEYQEGQEAFVEQQQPSTQIVNEADKEEENYGKGLDGEYFNPMNALIIIDLSWAESSDDTESTSISNRNL